MKTEAPWYWETDGGEHDHDAVGLQACVGDNGRVHYVRALRPGATLGFVPACGRHAKGLRMLEGPQVVECRICCAVAKASRDRIEQRTVRPVITGHSRMNFIARERGRKQRKLEKERGK